jgi:hypothetical protein
MNPVKVAFIMVGSALAVALCGVGCSEKSEQARAQSSTANVTMLIVPNASVGKVHDGMTIKDVMGELGEPQRRIGNAIEYPKLGFAVLPGPEGLVRVVMCGDVTGINGPFVKAFTGRTKEGVGMYSTREDLLKAYGEPTNDEKLRGGQESITYQPLGITFTLEGGKVHHMIVRFTPPQEPGQTTVTLEPSNSSPPPQK